LTKGKKKYPKPKKDDARFKINIQNHTSNVGWGRRTGKIRKIREINEGIAEIRSGRRI